MIPKTRLMSFYHTKGTFLRRTTYFEPSNVKIGQGVWAVQVSKNKVGKGRDRKIGLAFSPICGEKWDKVIITKVGLPVYTGCVMIYFVLWPYNSWTTVLE